MTEDEANAVTTLLGAPGQPLVFGYDRDRERIVSPSSASVEKIAEFMAGLEALHKSTGIRLASKAALSQNYQGTFTRFCIAFNGSTYQMEPAQAIFPADKTAEASDE
jgi:hypothetical protein